MQAAEGRWAGAIVVQHVGGLLQWLVVGCCRWRGLLGAGGQEARRKW